MEIERVSQLSGVKHIRDIKVTNKDLEGWQASGTHIQHYFPHLSADDREFILTGITPEEWDAAFGDEVDEDFLPEEFDAMLAAGESVEIVFQKDVDQ